MNAQHTRRVAFSLEHNFNRKKAVQVAMHTHALNHTQHAFESLPHSDCCNELVNMMQLAHETVFDGLVSS